MENLTSRKLRAGTQITVVVLVLSGMFTHFGIGTLSAFGYEAFSAICPLGYMETALATRSLMPRLLIGFCITLLVTVVLGRVFCAWICPVPLVRRGLFSSNSAGDPLRHAGAERGLSPHIRYYVLGGALLSSALFGFPVFCLVCPIGLIFATFFAVIRLFHFNEPTLSVIVFPLIVVIEFILLRKWCGVICPVGALLGLIGRFNKILRPRINPASCLVTSRGLRCFACKRVCPEGIDLHRNKAGTSMCSKCRDCADICPAKAIRFTWWRKDDAAAD